MRSEDQGSEAACSCDESPTARKWVCKPHKIFNFSVLVISVLIFCVLSRNFSQAAVPVSEGSLGDATNNLKVVYNNKIEMANRHSRLANVQQMLDAQHRVAAERVDAVNMLLADFIQEDPFDPADSIIAFDVEVNVTNVFPDAEETASAVCDAILPVPFEAAVALMDEKINNLTAHLRRAEMRLKEREQIIADQYAVIEEILLVGAQLEGRLELLEKRLRARDDSVLVEDTVAKSDDVVGRRVQAIWSDGNIYAGFTTDRKYASNGKALYFVEFDDGDRAWIEGSKVQLIPEEEKVIESKIPAYAVGQRVTALWESNGNYYEGVVSEVRGEDYYFISFDDGDTAVVKESNIQPIESFKYSSGERVLAKWPNNNLYYSGIVVACHPRDASDAGCDIQFDDGDRAVVPMRGIKRLDQRKGEAPVTKFTVGQKVRALWRENGKFYPAVIHFVDESSSTYSVIFKHRKRRNQGGITRFLRVNEIKPIFHLKAANAS